MLDEPEEPVVEVNRVKMKRSGKLRRRWTLSCPCWCCEQIKTRHYWFEPSSEQIEEFQNDICEECEKMGEDLAKEMIREDPEGAREVLDLIGDDEEWAKEVEEALKDDDE